MLKKKLMAVGVATVFTLSSLSTTVLAADFGKVNTGVTIKLTNPGKGNVKVKNDNKKYKFNDCYDSQWAVNAIEKLAGKGILGGIGQGKFAPKSNVTHVEALAMVLRLTGDNDEAESLGKKVHPYYMGVMPLWGYGYIYIAIEKGILLPEELKGFNPNQPAKRHEIAKYIIRAMGETEEALDNMDADLDFKDADAIPDKSVGYVYLVNELNIMVGDDNDKFNPMDNVTRAQMAVLLDRAEGKFDLPDTDNRKNGTIFVSADEDDNEITVKVKGVTTTYEYLEDVNVYKNGDFADIDELEAGDVLQLTLNSSKKVIFIEVVKNSEDTDEEETPVSFSEISYSKLPGELQDEIDAVKSTESYKAFEYGDYIYLLATMGKRNTGGYDIDIEKVTKLYADGEYTIKAQVDTDEPSSSSIVTQAITYPLTVVRFKSFDDIESVIFVDGDGDKLKEVSIEDIDEISLVEGEIYDLIAGSRTIKVEKSNGAKVSYTVPSGAEIIVNGDDDAKFSDLEEGMSVELEITDNKVTKVTAENAEGDEISFKTVEYSDLAARLKDQVDRLKLTKNYKAFEYEGDIYLIATMGKRTSDDYKIDIEDLDRVKDGSKYIVRAEVAIETPSSTSGSKTVYPYSIVRFDKFSNISKIRFVDEDGNKLADASIAKIDDAYEVTGTIEAVNTSKETINVKKSNGSVVTLSIPDDAEITVNDDEDESFSDLKVGMSVEIEIVDDVVTKVVAEDKEVELDGELTGISISTEKKITVKVDGKSRTYTVGSNVEIIIDDEDDMRVEDLKVGDKLTLTFINGALVQIEK